MVVDRHGSGQNGYRQPLNVPAGKTRCGQHKNDHRKYRQHRAPHIGQHERNAAAQPDQLARQQEPTGHDQGWLQAGLPQQAQDSGKTKQVQNELSQHVPGQDRRQKSEQGLGDREIVETDRAGMMEPVLGIGPQKLLEFPGAFDLEGIGRQVSLFLKVGG